MTDSGASSLVDRIYELLDGIDDDLKYLDGLARSEKIEVYAGESILDAVELLAQFEYDSRLGLAPTDLAKFHALKGRLDAEIVRHTGIRAKALLRELEGQVRHEAGGQPGSTNALEDDDIGGPTVEIEVVAQSWLPIDRQSNADLIAEISERIDEAVRLATSTNLAIDDRALSEIERAQLIALLETALQVLKAPLVERGLLVTLTELSKKGAAKAVEKGAELALAYGLKKIAELIAKLIANAFS